MRNELLFTDPDRAGRTPTGAPASGSASAGRPRRRSCTRSPPATLTEAVELVASSWRPLAYTGGHQTVEAWLSALPREVRRGDARLCVASAVVAIGTGRVDEVAPWIELAATAPAAGPFHDGFPSGPAAAARLRSVNSWLTGDLGACRAEPR